MPGVILRAVAGWGGRLWIPAHKASCPLEPREGPWCHCPSVCTGPRPFAYWLFLCWAGGKWLPSSPTPQVRELLPWGRDAAGLSPSQGRGLVTDISTVLTT